MNTAGDSEIRELYRSVILDHAKAPRHFGGIENATHTAEGINPVCGDKLRLFLSVHADTIDDIGFEGSGCAISVASASMMTDRLLGRSLSDAASEADSVSRTLKGEAAETLPGKLEALKGVREYPSRVKCATLAWHALGAAIANDGVIAKTE